MNSQFKERNFLQSVSSGYDIESQERNIKFNIARLN